MSSISHIHRAHDFLRDIKVDDPEAFREHVNNNDNNNNNIINNKSNKNNDKNKIQVIDLYKMTKHLREIFGSVRGEFGECLRLQEVKKIIKNNLFF